MPHPAQRTGETAGAEHRLAALLVAPAFERLRVRLGAFNPLAILRVADHEIRHSNILAWLLDPTGNHGLRDAFLRRFLLDAVQRNEHLAEGFPLLDVARRSLADARVQRESDHIDILVRIPSLRITCSIENKVHAGESKGQLARYRMACAKRFPDDIRIHLLLTLDNVEPSDPAYGRYGHAQVHALLGSCLEQAGSSVPNQVRDFLHHYLNTIQVMTMDDDELKRICREIYRDHRDAIDLINRYCADSGWTEACETFQGEHDVDCLYQNGANFWFLPKDIAASLPAIGDPDWLSRRMPLAMWFNWTNRNRFGLILEVGPLADASLRVRFLRHLKDGGFSFSAAALNETGKYTRIASVYRDFGGWDDAGAVAAQMRALYAGFEPHVSRLKSALTGFKWEQPPADPSA